MAWIETGLIDLARVIDENHIRSIAVPALGCGTGGLAWLDVKPKIEAAFRELPDIDVMIFEPAPEFEDLR